MSRNFERFYPYFVGMIAAFLFGVFRLQLPNGSEILSASITMAAIFTGFLATTKSLVISLDTPAMRELRATKFFNLLVEYLREAIYSSLAVVVFGIGGFFYDSTNPPHWYGWIWAALMSITILAFFRVTNSLLDLIKLRKE